MSRFLEELRLRCGEIVGLLLVLAALLLPGCSLPMTVDVPKEVKVRVSTSCVDPEKRPKRPELRAEADLMAMDRNRRTLAAYSDLKKHEIYMAELEAQVEACSRIPIP